MKVAPFEIIKSYSKGIEWYKENGVEILIDFIDNQ